MSGLLFFIIALTGVAAAQTNVPVSVDRPDSAGARPVDSVALSRRDTGASDTAAISKLEQSLGIRISKDAMPAIVTTSATDSAVLDMKRNLFYLYGDAKVDYEDLTLKAGQITYDQSDNSVSAVPIDDSSVKGARPSFKQGSETFTYDYLKYNFKSKRAIVRNARTQYGEGFVHSEQIKRNPDNSIYGFRSRYTTCSLDTPHFSIRMRHLKIIPGHIIVSGAANLEIEGVPTPLFLPFGVFPITETQRSGFRIPSYTIEEQRGLGITNGGYYFYISDKADLLLLTSIYSKGSYNVSASAPTPTAIIIMAASPSTMPIINRARYMSRGASIDKQFAIQWRHQTDPKARPGQSFNTSVNIIKGNYYQDNSYNPNQILQNQFQSNVTYSKAWNGRLPASFTASLLHNQNTANHIVNVTLPDIGFQPPRPHAFCE